MYVGLPPIPRSHPESTGRLTRWRARLSLLAASCLEQGLALVMLLAVSRVPARLVIGVSRPGSMFAAHAWVECGGRVVLGAAQAADFVPLPSIAALPCRG
jgi:hypothetical protein